MIYKLDCVLTTDGLTDFAKSLGQKVKHVPSNLKYVLDYYSESLQSASGAVKYPEHLDQEFTANFPLYKDNFITLKWNIAVANELIKEYSISVTTLCINEVLSSSTVTEVNSSHLDYALKNNNPIIVAEMPQSPTKNIVIDGNHRVISRLHKSYRAIDAHVLQPSIHMLAMSSDLYCVLFGVYFNLAFLLSYMSGKQTMEELVRGMYRFN
ncbi:MAG: hypothetical protein KGZ79_16580 [Dethiobacter sp.]|jgi:hypothetical protein|nr:hypothetical protein [Dethiobacter sp.]